MKYIKEFCPRGNHAVVRSDTYAKSVEHVDNMAQILIDDFGVSKSDIRTVLYAGDYYAKTLGVEVQVDPSLVTDDYREISQLEMYYG